MALQQLSFSGASSPIASDPTSGGGADTASSVTTTGGTASTTSTGTIGAFNLKDYLAKTSGLANPDSSGSTTPIVPFTGDVNSPQAYYEFLGGDNPGGVQNFPGNPYSWDPFSAGGAGEFAQIPNEAASQGYKDFGSTWLDLLNTVATKDPQWGGTNQFGGELKGGGSTGGWLQPNVVDQWNQGNKQQSYDAALDFISSQTGLDPKSPEAQKLGGAFLEYTLQNSNRYGLNTQNFDQRKSSGGKDIFGSLLGPIEAIASIAQPELAPIFAAASFGDAIANGNPLGAITSALGGLGGGFSDIANIDTGLGDTLGLTDSIASGVINPTDASFLQDFGTAGDALRFAGRAAGLGGAISSGDPLGIAMGASGLGIAGSNLYDSIGTSGTGTTGTNAPGGGGGIMSGIANTLGIDPSTLKNIEDYGGVAATLGGTAVPLVQNALNAPGTLDQLGNSAPLPPPAAPVSTPGTPSAPGSALSPVQEDNPAQKGYLESALGGGLGESTGPNNSVMESMLNQLGA